jgi:energy-coupling factor transporter ATP-binding protein EcfA2
MILHRLEVEGFRCFTSKVAVGLDPERINILHGGNGSGKSSLLWALVRGLFDTYRAGGKSVEALRPWGTDLAPAILVEFEHGGKIYRLEKRFLESRGARLEEKQGGKFKPLAHNEKAEERVREMLLSDQPTVGLCKPEKWGLARALWCPQEHLAIEGFDGRVLGSIQELLGKQALDKDALALKDTIDDAFLEYWTDKGKPKGGKGAPLWVHRQADLAPKQDELTAWERELEELHAAQEAAQALQDERLKMQNQLAVDRDAAGQLQTKADEYVPLVSLCEKLKAQWEGKRAEAVALEGNVKRVAELREKQERSAGRLGELDTAISREKAGEQGLKAAFDKSDEQMKALQSGDPTVTSLERITADAAEYNEARRESQDLQLRIQQVEGAQNQIAQWKEQSGRIQAPDQKALAELEQHCARRLQFQTQLDSALLHVELRPNGGRRVEVIHGEPSGPRQLGAGDSLKVSGSPTVDLELEGFGRLTVTGPTQSATELKDELGTVARLIDDFVSRFGTSDVADLRQRRQESSDLALQVANEEKTVQGLLGGRTLASMRSDAARLRQAGDAAEASHLDWRDAPPNAEQLKAQLVEARQALEERRSGVTAEWKKSQTELAKVQKSRVGFEAEREHLRKQSGEDQGHLSNLRADGLSDLARSERLSQLSVEVLGLEAKYKQEFASLQKLGDDPRPALERAQRDCAAADSGFEKADRALYEHRGTLKKMLDRAPYEQYARVEEQIKELRAEIDRDQLRAEALKLLRQTINECEEEATAGVAGPVADRASKLLQRIAGKGIGAISLNDDLAPWGVGPAETDETIDLEVLSGGEREQVHLAVRLALAELLTKDAGQKRLVVLDDVMTATDDERLGRVIAVLEEMRSHAQFVILTCHPERYKPLKGAKFIDMANLRN